MQYMDEVRKTREALRKHLEEHPTRDRGVNWDPWFDHFSSLETALLELGREIRTLKSGE